MHPVDPGAREIDQLGEVARAGQPFRLEAAHLGVDHALGLTGMAGSILTEARRGKNIRHMVEGLFWQSVFGRLAGYEDVNDADRLSLDPAMRTIVDSRGLMRNAASTRLE